MTVKEIMEQAKDGSISWEDIKKREGLDTEMEKLEKMVRKLEDDTISRQGAIDGLSKLRPRMINTYEKDGDVFLKVRACDVKDMLEALPSAQPELIRCKDCKYRDENWRRVSVRWLPCMDVRTGSNWYCGSAERGEQDEH